DGEPMRMSQHAAMAAPAPVHGPAIAAMAGTRIDSIALMTTLPLASYSSASCSVLNARNCEMSVPATNALPPAPVNTTARTERSALIAAQASTNSSYMFHVSALRASGRLKVIHLTGPF